MPNNKNYIFHPRGIEKWHAFSAVISEEEQVNIILEEDLDLIEEIEYIDEEQIFNDDYLDIE